MTAVTATTDSTTRARQLTRREHSRKSLTWLSIMLAVLTLPLAGATAVVVSFALEQRAGFPELEAALNAYAVSFSLGGICIILAVVMFAAAAASARRRGMSGATLTLISTGTWLLAGTTLIVCLMFVSAFYVPGGGPLFAPTLLILTVLGIAGTMALMHWQRSCR